MTSSATIAREHGVLSDYAVAPLRAAIIEDFAAFTALETQWNALVDSAGILHPFLTHDWIRSWWEAFGAGRALRVVLIYRGERMVAIAPLMISRTAIYGIPVRELASLSNDHTPRFDFVLSPEESPEALIDAIWIGIRQMDRQWDVVKLCQLEEDSAVFTRIPQLAEKDCWCGTWESTASPYLPLAGSFNGHYSTLPRGLRSNLKRRMKRLEEIGPVEFQQVSSAGQIDAALAEAFRMEAGTWKGAEGTAIACHHELAQFYKSIAHRAAGDGTLYFTFLLLNGQRIAFDLSLIYRQRLFKLKPGYSQEHHALSPGQQLTTMTVRDAFERGLVEVDFLGSDDEWKLAWTKNIRRHRWIYLFRKNLLGSLLYWAKFHLAPRLHARERAGSGAAGATAEKD